MSKPSVKISLQDFKTRLSDYLQKLHYGEEDAYIVRRYKRDVAIVMGLRTINLKGRAREDAEKIQLYLRTLERHEEERRIISARLLSWPQSKYYGCPGWWERLQKRRQQIQN